ARVSPRRGAKEGAERQEELEALLATRRSESAAALALAESAAGEARGLDEQIHTTEKELVAARHDLLAADDEAARLQRKSTVLDAERAQAEHDRDAALRSLAETDTALAAAEIERNEGHRRR